MTETISTTGTTTTTPTSSTSAPHSFSWRNPKWKWGNNNNNNKNNNTIAKEERTRRTSKKISFYSVVSLKIIITSVIIKLIFHLTLASVISSYDHSRSYYSYSISHVSIATFTALDPKASKQPQKHKQRQLKMSKMPKVAMTLEQSEVKWSGVVCNGVPLTQPYNTFGVNLNGVVCKKTSSKSVITHLLTIHSFIRTLPSARSLCSDPLVLTPFCHYHSSSGGNCNCTKWTISCIIARCC